MWNALFDFGFGRQFLILHGVQLLNTTQLSVWFIHGSDVFVFPSSNVNWMEVLMLVYTLNFTFYLCSLTHHFQPNRQTLWCHTFNRAFWYIWNWKSLKREQFSRNKSENLRRLLLFHAFRSNSFCRINNYAFNLKVHCRFQAIFNVDTIGCHVKANISHQSRGIIWNFNAKAKITKGI